MDKLTGLMERKPFLVKVEDEVRRSKRYRRPASFLVVDINHNFFSKETVVRWSMGYSLVKQMAAVLKTSLRDVDTLARFDGEIFAAFLPETDLEGAAIAAERVRSAVEEHLFMGTNIGDKVKVAVSIGTSTFPDHAEHLDELLEIARKAMQVAHEEGGNKVGTGQASPTLVIEEPEPSS